MKQAQSELSSIIDAVRERSSRVCAMAGTLQHSAVATALHVLNALRFVAMASGPVIGAHAQWASGLLNAAACVLIVAGSMKMAGLSMNRSRKVAVAVAFLAPWAWGAARADGDAALVAQLVMG